MGAKIRLWLYGENGANNEFFVLCICSSAMFWVFDSSNVIYFMWILMPTIQMGNIGIQCWSCYFLGNCELSLSRWLAGKSNDK